MPMFTAAIALAVAAAPAQHHTFTGLALAPQGDRIAVLEAQVHDDATAIAHKTLVIRDATKGGVIAQIDPCPACDYQDPAFSPDGRRIAFLGHDRKAGTTTLYLVTQGAVTTRTVITGVAERPRFAPDGRTLALLVIPGAHKEVGATQAAAAQVGDIGENTDEKRIAVLAVDGQGAPRAVSPADSFVYEYDWTPGGTGFVATLAKGDGDNNWWVAHLAAVDLASGSTQAIAAPAQQMNFPRVSPDGRSVAYIGGLMSDYGSVGGDIWLVQMSGGTARNLTPGFAGTFTSLQWRGGRIMATALIGDRETIVVVDPAGGKTQTLWSAPVSTHAGDAQVALDATGKRAALVIEDYDHAPEVAAGAIATLGLATTITHENEGLTGAGTARNVTWTSEGRTVQGWLLAPKTVAPGKTYPMVVVVHGGPSAASTPTYFTNTSLSGTMRHLLDRGYFLFLPNPRGSYGQGEAFARANIRDFGGGDLRDILAGIDAVEKITPVDDKRLGIFGHSYGGFMTMWTVTHSQRFHAAVAGAGIANWTSYYGENGIDTWMIPFFGASVYDDPAIYRKLSPLETIKAARTPTFLYVGERDVECPTPQSTEFWHGLKEMGVKTRLLVLAGEGHGIRQPDHLRAVDQGTVDWFDTYLAK
ncbi:prolyl oligopeptidase family serine peptidase [Novosphingobium sp.]|uniref:alpha/beta hydrolase family protein n=1 Tax=Novosphingobium sp. TaxID=1874826 RepID=UPI003B52C3AF